VLRADLTRTTLPGRGLVGVLAVLPMITPPFVIGLALIMLFGRSGALNAALEFAVRHSADALDLRAARRVAGADARADARRVLGAGGVVEGSARASRRRRRRCMHRASGRSRRSRCR
jgi:hypothetical protein